MGHRIDQLKEALLVLECRGGHALEIAEKLGALGNLYCSAGAHFNAEHYYWRALELRQTFLGPADIKVASSLQVLAELYELLGQNSKAELLYDSLVAILIDLPAGDIPDAIKIIERVSGFYSTHRLSEGVTCLEELIEKFRPPEGAGEKPLGHRQQTSTHLLNDEPVHFDNQLAANWC